MATSKETLVIVECPRCDGEGGRLQWQPDAGVCYLCGGKGHLNVNIERGERHLAVLRREWRAAKAAGDTVRLQYITRKGILKRALVEAAKAAI